MTNPFNALKDVTEFYENNFNFVYEQIFNPLNHSSNNPDSFSHDEMVNDEVALSIEEIIANSEEEQKRKIKTNFQSYENEYLQFQNE